MKAAVGMAAQPPGTVSLVGAGPGDPGLLTLRALRRLRQADVVYHDALVPAEILALCGPRTRRVQAGKRRGAAAMTQELIQRALAAEAAKGLRVVRLKGGDPFVFGRGGEEALWLASRGIPVEVVPGISAGIGVPALAGIPLTHRGLSGSAAFVTAHQLGRDAAGAVIRRRLRALAAGAETLVIFMAGAEQPRLRRTLREAGLHGATPVAIIENGSLPVETVRLTTLDRLGRPPASRGGGPVLLVVGRTVSLAARLRADRAPVSGKPGSPGRRGLQIPTEIAPGQMRRVG